MILTLHTEVTIDCAHKLEGHQGLCQNLHGHTWKIELWFRGPSSFKDSVGIIIDFGIVKALKEKLDHKYINDVIGMNPTAENMVEWIYDFVKSTAYLYNDNPVDLKVRVYETAVDKLTWCEGGDF